MTRSGTSLVTALAGLLVALSLPMTASASATVRYVSRSGKDNATCPQSQPCLTIAHAIAVAQAGDTIDIGPGTFTEGGLKVEKELYFTGAGSGTASSYDPTQDTLIDGSKVEREAIFDTAGGSFSALRINGGYENAIPFERAYPALYLASIAKGSTSFSVSNVVTTQPTPGSLGTATAPVLLAAAAGSTNIATITDLTAIGSGEALELDSLGTGTVNLNLSHSTLREGKEGEAALRSLGNTEATVSDTTASGKFGALLFTGGRLTATGDSFTGTNGGLKLRTEEKGLASATLRDSLAVALPTTTGAQQAGVLLLSEKAGSSTELSATNSTIVSYGKGASAGLQLESTSGATATAQLANSIAYGDDPTTPGTQDILAEGPGTATVTAESSGYSNAGAKSGATITPAGSAGNISGNPDFANPADESFMLTSASPLLESGNPALVQPGELDLAGNPRTEIECGRALDPDIGAYELQRAFACPIASPISSGGTASSSGSGGSTAAGTPRAPAIESASISAPLRAHRRKHAQAGKLLFTLSEAATVNVTLERLASGHLRKKACIAKVKTCKRLVTITATHLSGRAGKNTVAFPSVELAGHLRAGSYEIVLVAVSAQGTRSASRTLRFSTH
jgi:hypothetical protein